MKAKNTLLARLLIALTCLASFIVAGNAPADIVVTNGDDSGPGSLRQAIADAAPDSTITFSYTGVITLTTAEFLIDKNLTISGPGSAIVTVNRDPNASNRFRILEVSAGAAVNISGITLSGGGVLSDKEGAGILNAGSLSLNDVQIINNAVFGDVFPFTVPLDGGGCSNSMGAEMSLTNCT